MEYVFLDECGRENRVVFEKVSEKGKLKPYGISAKIYEGDVLKDSAVARERYISETETDEVLKMLCRFQVTPCTLCDVI